MKWRTLIFTSRAALNLLTCAEIGTRNPKIELMNIPQPRNPSEPYFFAIIPKGICKMKSKTLSHHICIAFWWKWAICMWIRRRVKMIELNDKTSDFVNKSFGGKRTSSSICCKLTTPCDCLFEWPRTLFYQIINKQKKCSLPALNSHASPMEWITSLRYITQSKQAGLTESCATVIMNNFTGN